jgi:hypothetical protein
MTSVHFVTWNLIMTSLDDTCNDEPLKRGKWHENSDEKEYRKLVEKERGKSERKLVRWR